MKIFELVSSQFKRIANRINTNVYGNIILAIILIASIGFVSTIITDDYLKKLFSYFSIFALFSGVITVLISLVEAKKHQNPLIVVLDLLLVIVIYASVYACIYNYDSQAFSFQSGDHSYLNLLYFSFTTFTTTGYGDITPLSYLAKFTSASESFLFAGAISIAMLNFSNSLDPFVRNNMKKEDKT